MLASTLAALAVLATAGPALAHHRPWHHGGPPWARPYHGPRVVYVRPRPPVVYERPYYGYYERPRYYYRRPEPVYVEPPPYYIAPTPGISINIPLQFD
jgi:hypothetical protein